MPRKLEVEIVGDPSSLKRAFREVDGHVGKLGDTFKRMSVLAVAGGTVAAGGLAFAGKKMIGLASDAAEVDSKFKVVFGKTVPDMKKNLDAFSRATGASRFELRQQAADMGALLKPMLGSVGAASKMSIATTKLATDLSSFNNVPVGEALESIRSGLVGEAEPMRKFGVLINEAAVKAEAYKSGIAKTGAVLTEAQKVQARYNLIMQQTTLAHGDAERTSGSMANQMRRLKNSVKDAATEIGMKLVPFANEAVGVLNKMITRIGEAQGTKAKFGVVFTGIGDALKKLREALFGGMEVLGGSQGMIKIPFKGMIQKGIDAVDWGETAAKLVKAISDAIQKINWEKIGSIVGPGIAAGLVAGLATLVDPGFWFRHWQEIASIALALVPIGRLAEIGGKFVAFLVKPVSDLLGTMFRSAVGKGGDILLATAEALGPRLGGIMLNVVLRAGAEIAKLPGLIGGQLAKIPGVVAEKLGGFPTLVLKFFAFETIIHGVATGIGDIVSMFASLPGRIASGISGAMKFLKDRIGDLFSWKKIVGWIRDALGFGSPSPHFMAIGHDIIDSMIRGVGSAAGLLKNAVSKYAKDALRSLGGGVGGALGAIGNIGGGGGGLSDHVEHALLFARQHGWHGSVISGFRTYAEQAALYARYVASGFNPRYIAAKPGTSSHESGNAVDVSDAVTFDRIMNYTPIAWRLYNNVPGDFGHFSVSGYGLGGIAGLHGPELAILGERGPEMVIPIPSVGIPDLGSVTQTAIGIGQVAAQAAKQGAYLGGQFKTAFTSQLNQDMIQHPLAVAKANADQWADTTGASNMAGVGSGLATALGTGFKRTLPTFLGGDFPAQGPSFLGGGYGATGPTHPAGVGAAPIVNVYVSGSVTTERDLSIAVRDQLVRQGQRSGGGMFGNQA
jgi:D-alanyl-D-alanine carboxypeptidase